MRRRSGDSRLKYQRIVAKIGTNVLTAGTERLDVERMASLVAQAAELHGRDADVLFVTSGAIAAGRHRLGNGKGRKDMPYRQVLAAIGQSDLMQIYRELFDQHDIMVAQTLLTRADLADRVGYLNARNTLLAMLELRVLPVINENDVVAIDEIEGSKIGDNDNLSALVTNLVDADLLVLLTDIGGLYTSDPRVHPDAELIPRVEQIDARIEGIAGATRSAASVGGMATKVQAAKLVTGGGADMVIADGKEPDVLVRVAEGVELGTLFPATADRMESRRRWMLAGLSVKGDIMVDEGAARALREKKTSLLPAGISSVHGKFERGDPVAVIDESGRRIACGIANYSAGEIARIRGQRSDRIEGVLGHHYGAEVVHRDNLVVL